MSVEVDVFATEPKRTSWGSIFAGVFTAVAVWIIMACLGLALGFHSIDPMSNQPFAYLGMTFGIWSAISALVSLAAGAFVSGFLARRDSGLHGLITWAAVLVFCVAFGVLMLGAAAWAVGSAASAVGGGVAGAAGGFAENITNINLDLNTDALENDVRDTLRDTGIETLQPEYLEGQMRAARSDLRKTVNRLLANPDSYQTIISDFLSAQESRLEAIGAGIDRNSAITALMRTRGMTRTEAEQTVDNAVSSYNQLLGQAQNALHEARQQLEDMQQHMEVMLAQARQAADQARSAAAASALAAAIALIIGGGLSYFCGVWGGRISRRRDA